MDQVAAPRGKLRMFKEDESSLLESMGLRREVRVDLIEVAKLVLLCIAVGSIAVAPLLAG